MKWLALLLIVLISGCTEKVVYYENTTKIETLQTEYAQLQTDYTAQETEFETCTNGLAKSYSDYAQCNTSLETALGLVQLYNGTGNFTVPAMYSFTCTDVPSQFAFLTKYPCYWITRDKYGFGKYYDVASGCISLGLPDVCRCYWSIPEFTGVRASTGAYPGFEKGTTLRNLYG